MLIIICYAATNSFTLCAKVCRGKIDLFAVRSVVSYLIFVIWLG